MNQELLQEKENNVLLFIRMGDTPSPIRLDVVLQEFSPDVFAGVEAGGDRVHDARSPSTGSDLRP